MKELTPLNEPSSTEDGYQFTFRLNFDNRDYMAGRQGHCLALEKMSSSSDSSGCEGLAPLFSSTLLQLFPFTLIFRPDLQIIDSGRQLTQMFPEGTLVGQTLPDVSRMRRPKLRLTWDNVIASVIETSPRYSHLFLIPTVIQPPKSALRVGIAPNPAKGPIQESSSLNAHEGHVIQL